MKNILYKIWYVYAFALVLSSIVWTLKFAYCETTKKVIPSLDIVNYITGWLWFSFFILLCLGTAIGTIWCIDYLIKDFFDKK